MTTCSCSRSQVNRVRFGLLRARDMPNMPENMASARKVLAVPFVGKDVPSKAAEFANPEVPPAATTYQDHHMCYP